MKIREIPSHLWSKHPYLTIAGTIIGLSGLVAASFITLGLGLLIPGIIIGALFSIVAVSGLFKYSRSETVNSLQPRINLSSLQDLNIPAQTMAFNKHPSNLSNEQFDPEKLRAASKTGDKTTLQKHLDLWGKKILIEALQNGKTEKALETLKSFGSTERTLNVLKHANNMGDSILGRAIIFKNKAVVYEILNLTGLSVEQKMSLLSSVNDFGQNALAIAASAGDSEIVALLLDSIPEDERSKLMNYRDTSEGALDSDTIDVVKLAFNSGHHDTVKVLEKYGAVLPKARIAGKL